MWQDYIFAVGALVSLATLLPTLLSRTSVVQTTTSVTAATLGFIYGLTFLSLGMTTSALGSFTIGAVWAGIAAFRRPARSCQSTVSERAGSSMEERLSLPDRRL